ncbi:LysM peptidoglycan-binding domain-containing protein [Acinetobacter nosocomialis]|uniref:lytic transglycosylase n=1 Tax=Acinetobacter calcoaceticus/baumannii complex TaxID=909768 RepID=UPI0020CFE113|nr:MULTISPECIES: LysM peptidoglycan-binding domain-containing protein [Acinetobacter calcoaceticus/baumannii complex]MCQ1047355.1 LysM peptidoglycan-binding domain-containing protein [Acinetobacter baumannii]MDA3497528.1 LysM peptidoglycan-binding domain-containing protein [Acinetobacter baumannii]MDA3536472.1 LysM peptidoglycan-binding domain-containing protein [Acinetobacter baumannii]MDA4982931.1 LysM peptidoglycan-binding domain-containing protein [Acinetobacter baumannii]MDC9816266.1 LysM
MYKPTTFVWQPSAASLFKITVLSSALAALGITTGCSSTPQSAKTSKTKQVSGAGYLDASSLDSLEDLLSATDMRAVEGDRLLILKHGDVWKRMAVGFKMDLNHWDPRIEAQRSWFISRQPYLDRLSARASRYLYHTVKEAERRGLPTELALLPVIESSYDPAATSSAAAAGLWQFIPSTGRIYGLQQTGMYDGRRDVVESTRAAYEFLGSLYNQFGSWELALAAYNAGPGRIQQAINRNQAAGLPTDYWSLKLPQETMNYVPRFLAVAQIIKNPRAYGVSLPPIANRPHFREVTLSAPLSLNEIASVTGLSRAELYALNPGYRGETVDPASPMRILIPADVSPSVDNKLKAMKAGGSSSGWWANVTSPSKPTTTTSTSVTVKTTPATQVQPVRSTTPTKTTGSSVTVKTSTPRGSDALAAFAASADVPSAPRIPVAVTPATNVKPVRTEPPISAVEREKILAAVRAEGEKETVEQALQPQATQAEKDQVVAELKAIAPQGTEIVDPYDGKIKLTAIQTSLSVAEQQGKELSKGFAYPKTLAEDASVANSEDGQRNKDKPYIKTDTDVVVVQPKGKRSTYTVQPGDTLAIIAMKNGVNWRDVAKWNQIDPEKTLFVGTSLYLYDAKPQEVESTAKAAAKPDVYVVQANDSLTGVANQFNLSVKQLAEYNDLSVSDGLFVGQKLHLKEPKGNRTSAKAEQPKAVQASTRRIATKSYTVKRGEYLKLIADRYALSNQELAELTPGLSAGSNLMVGQKINVPAKEVTVDEVDDNKASGKYEKLAAGPSYKTESYKVQRGDTLSSIAAKSKISLAELAELNNLKANSHVQLGQNLKVPAGVSVPDHYVVQSGDSLHAIAAKYNLQTSYLADLNGLSRTAGVRAGQRLKLTGEVETPSKATTKNTKEETPETYTVKSGDSLGNIANRYHLQLDYLASLNGLSRNSNVRVGQRLKLTGDVPPVETAKVDTAKSAVKPVAAGKNTEKYTVKAGESLHTIASRAGISVRELAEMNALKANANLQRGQNIVIPKTVVEYKVKRGDTLIGLASKYGLETTLLAELNNLTPSTQLRIGDIIKVPNL